jgi:four helix bundle protein
MSARDFRELLTWQKSVDLIVEVYKLTKAFPAEERSGITDQLRRAAVSVASNIAEGNGRGSRKDNVKFLSYSRGSLHEIVSLIYVSKRLDLVPPDETTRLLALSDEVGRMLGGLRRSLIRDKRREPEKQAPVPGP